jgi:RNA polymerase sigma factor (sigma-70 family)
MADGNLAPETFNQLMADLRPSLHRYCARMVGSAFDGEDVVQEALAKAAAAFPTAEPIEHPDRWLFRIAHNAALDALRGRKRQAMLDETFAEIVDPAAVADARVAATASLAVLLRLPVVQRSCVVLIDVLGHSLDETAQLLDLTLPATKAALHRGRVRLKDLAEEPDAPLPAWTPPSARGCAPMPTASTPATSTPCAPCSARTCGWTWPTAGASRAARTCRCTSRTTPRRPDGGSRPAWPRAAPPCWSAGRADGRRALRGAAGLERRPDHRHPRLLLRAVRDGEPGDRAPLGASLLLA